MDRPRLLVIASTYPALRGDGTPAFVRDLAMQTAKRFDTTVLVPRVPGASAREWDGPLQIIRYRYFPRRFESLADGAIIENLRSDWRNLLQVVPFFVAQFFALRQVVKQVRPDVLHVHWIIPQGIVARVAARALPRVVTTLGGDLYALNDPLSRWLKRKALESADIVTVMNRDMAARVRSLGADPATTRVVPMGAETAILRRLPLAASGSGPVRLLFVGRLVEKKGLTVLLHALSGIDRSRYHLSVVGDGPLRGLLETQAAGMPVAFEGALGRDSLDAALAVTDIVVTPSVAAASGDQDGLPVALLEAMAAARAVIASDLPGINEVISNHENGLLVVPGDADALREGITRLIDEPELRLRLAMNAREASSTYSTEAVGSRYRDLLDSLVSRR